jgi:type I restriction enzyme S subunit
MPEKAILNDSASVFLKELYHALPEGWIGKRLKYLSPIRFSNVDKKADPDQAEVFLCNYVDAYKNNFITNKIDFMKATASPEEIRKFSLFPNDVLITKDSETADDIGVPSFVAEKIENLVCGYHLAILRAFPMLVGKYLFRYLQSTLTASFFEKRANGITRFAIGMDTVGNCPVIFPPPQEQHRLVLFLDRETSRIDALISNKERQIELLQEKRQAVITRAVTKGLDPKAKMKESGVEWIGEIPEEWQVLPIRRFLSRIIDYRGRTPTKVDSGVQLVTARNIKNGRIDYESSREYISEEEADVVMTRGKPMIGDVLFTSEAPLGEVAQIDNADIVLAQRIILFRGNHRMTNDYLCLYLSSSVAQADVQSRASGSTAEGIRSDRLAQVLVISPPVLQQQKIVNFCSELKSSITASQELIKRSISLLHEYRSSLITAAVSGQIDVSKMMDKAPE